MVGDFENTLYQSLRRDAQSRSLTAACKLYMHKIFISHSANNVDWKKDLVSHLTQESLGSALGKLDPLSKRYKLGLFEKQKQTSKIMSINSRK